MTPLTIQQRQPLSPYRTFRDAVSDLPVTAAQYGETCAYASAPQNPFQQLMRSGSLVVTEHHAPKHGAKMLGLMAYIPTGKGAQDPEVLTNIPEHLRPGRSFPNSYKRIAWDQSSPSITSNFGTPSSANCIHPTELRALTIREAARCQSFPDSYIFCGNQGNKSLQIGNSIPPMLGFEIGKCLRAMFDGSAPNPDLQIAPAQTTTNQETNQCTQLQQAVYSPASGDSTLASSAPASIQHSKSNVTVVAGTSSVGTSRTRRVSRMSARSGRTISSRSISSTAGSRAKTSPKQDAARAWLEREVGSGSSSTELSANLNRLLSPSKMFLDFCPSVTEAISEPSFKGWGTAGIASPTGLLTLNSSCPSGENVSSLSQVLETSVAPKYSLSLKECQKLVRRHTTRPLHPILESAVRKRLSLLQAPKCSTSEEYTASV